MTSGGRPLVFFPIKLQRVPALGRKMKSQQAAAPPSDLRPQTSPSALVFYLYSQLPALRSQPSAPSPPLPALRSKLSTLSSALPALRSQPSALRSVLDRSRHSLIRASQRVLPP
jgi:hypothetical protein